MARGFSRRKDDARKAVLTIVLRRGHQRLDFAADGTELLIRREVLLCGHIIRIPQDIYGETNAYKRRCQECGKLRERVQALSANQQEAA